MEDCNTAKSGELQSVVSNQSVLTKLQAILGEYPAGEEERNCLLGTSIGSLTLDENLGGMRQTGSGFLEYSTGTRVQALGDRELPLCRNFNLSGFPNPGILDVVWPPLLIINLWVEKIDFPAKLPKQSFIRTMFKSNPTPISKNEAWQHLGDYIVFSPQFIGSAIGRP
jgi:hypothetical protein